MPNRRSSLPPSRRPEAQARYHKKWRMAHKKQDAAYHRKYRKAHAI